ncbi:MAG: hypothetical protein ACRDOY_11100 [Nocardioidaceae bacterium]
MAKAQQRGQCGGVFHREAAALAEIRRHRVRGVAKQHDTAVPEGRKASRELFDGESVHRVRTRSLEQFGNRRIPLAEQPPDRSELVRNRRSVGHRGDGKLIHAPVGERSDAESTPLAPRLTGFPA